MKICSSNFCVSCYACINACPNHCLSMQENTHGESFPLINEKDCINCNACINVCPLNKPLKYNKPIDCYAAWYNNDEIRKSCASGGIATALSQKIIKEGGVVYGAAVQKGIVVCHIRANSENDLLKLKGSKYVHSSIGESYKQVNNDLSRNIKVLFIGTPCQIAGLRSYLGKDFQNLITIDLICHGVPPIKYLREYISQLVKKKYYNIDNIVFRGKEYYNLSIYENNKILYSKKSEFDLYYQAYLQGLINMEYCYNCKFAQIHRISDITLGDFWGLGKDKAFEYDTYKVSVVLVNSLKGEEFINSTDNIVLIKRDLKEAYNGNDQLRGPSIPHKDREKFKYNYKKYGFITAVKLTEINRIVYNNIKNYYIGKVASIIPKPFKRIL